MGSQDDELTVLPFGDHQAVNPSWEIAKRLPSELPRTENGGPRVRIIVYPEPIRVSYRTVRKLVPTLWDDAFDDDDENDKKEGVEEGSKRRRHIDAAIHIGMAGPRAIYQLERRAHRDGYPTPDVDGALPEHEKDDKRPAELQTDLRLEDVLARWRNLSEADMDLRLSDDAGRFLCEFIYYASLSELLSRKRRRDVVFFHVPCHATERYIAQGGELAVRLVRALADSLVAGREEAPPLSHHHHHHHQTTTKDPFSPIREAHSPHQPDKATWWGCGKHIVTVMKDIPADQRCTCDPKIERDGNLYPPMGSKPAS
ncbi:hypothetical protein CP533_1445 [Ophiocordyceps camponoti-saundersi (nom. inval.)]|nr:hypothetical protein CP533_1445 [Ophiocordyceps camponoti-saundersi (nom. inval.)]